jgi:hypothetical protein
MNTDKRELRTDFVGFIQELMFIRVYLWLKIRFQTVFTGFFCEPASCQARWIRKSKLGSVRKTFRAPNKTPAPGGVLAAGDGGESSFC